MEHDFMEDNGRRILRLRANPDIANASAFKEILAHELSNKDELAFDFSEINYIDSSGIQLLIAFFEAAKAIEKKLSLEKELSEELALCLEAAGALYPDLCPILIK